jgi:hypothetical protein
MKFRRKRCGEKESVRSRSQELSVTVGKTIDDDDYTDTIPASLLASYNHEIASINAGRRSISRHLLPKLSLNSPPMNTTGAPETKVRNQTKKKDLSPMATRRTLTEMTMSRPAVGHQWDEKKGKVTHGEVQVKGLTVSHQPRPGQP